MEQVNAIPSWMGLNIPGLPRTVCDGMDLYVGILFELYFLGHVFVLGESNGSRQEKQCENAGRRS